jgi:hypothetical protein
VPNAGARAWLESVLAARLGAAIMRQGTDTMNIKRLLNIRPKPGASIPELREAIGAAETARAEAMAKAESLLAQRGTVLIDGTDAEISRHEIALNAARDDAGRASALHEALVTRLAEAERGERRAVFTTKLAEAEAANAAWRAFMNNAYPALARKLAAGLKLEAQAIRAAGACYYAFHELAPPEREGLEPSQGPDLLPNGPALGTIFRREPLGPRVELPALDGGAPYWPAHD